MWKFWDGYLSFWGEITNLADFGICWHICTADYMHLRGSLSGGDKAQLWKVPSWHSVVPGTLLRKAGHFWPRSLIGWCHLDVRVRGMRWRQLVENGSIIQGLTIHMQYWKSKQFLKTTAHMHEVCCTATVIISNSFFRTNDQDDVIRWEI